MGASALLDVGCKALTKHFTGEEKAFTETVSDAILDVQDWAANKALDLAADAGRAVTGAWSSAKDAFCGWGRSLGFA